MTARTSLALRTRVPRTLVALALAGSLVACGGGEDTAAEASPSAATCPLEATEVDAPAGGTTDLATKPVIAPGTGPAPTELQYADIVEGDGEEATTGDQVTVKYLGAIYETGKEFDSSWSTSAEQTLPFTVCRSALGS